MTIIKEWRAEKSDTLATRMVTSYTDLENFQPDYSKKRLIVQNDTPQSILKLARSDDFVYEKYIDIIRNDYLLISHKDGYSVFMKRKEYHPERLVKFKHLKRYVDLMYTLTPPSIKRKSPSLPNRLLVLFSHMNGGSGYDSTNVMDRMFVQYFSDIQRSLVKNVFVLRIADMNLSHGSYFVNTDNYPDYEEQIQNLIKEVMIKNNIDHDNVVLYGGSKGGTGAIYHAALGNYKAIAGDPIINSEKYNLNKDWHFVKNFKEADLTNQILENAKNNSNKMYIFASKAHIFNYSHSKNLAEKSAGLISIVDLSNDSLIKTHPHITAQSVPEQLTLMNLLLDGDKILGDFSKLINKA
ncbi:accessory Sec system protein Asp2 [uncultured Avibacterium sp.]|uniref:Accessory Sec system protein Asp2 n=1 Tax=uncultured Avibacterium sp. TaxID=1936169 RepID=A0A486XFG8_9PAST|nr:accessory Sec system protein Asp2 [uncultured Avibacterium sp.]